MSKGDRQRKSQVPEEQVREQWEKIFQKKKKKKAATGVTEPQ